MSKIVLVVQESMCDGEVLVNVTPCATIDIAKKVMADEIHTLITSSRVYRGINLNDIEKCQHDEDADCDFILERNEEHFFLRCAYDDYYEDITIKQEDLITDENYVSPFHKMNIEQIRYRMSAVLSETDEEHPLSCNITIGASSCEGLGYHENELPVVFGAFQQPVEGIIWFNIFGLSEPVEFDDLSEDDLLFILECLEGSK